MNPNQKHETLRKPYVAPSIQLVQADPVTELLQGTGACGTIPDGCQDVGLPIC